MYTAEQLTITETRSVLVVEDELLIALDLEHMLKGMRLPKSCLPEVIRMGLQALGLNQGQGFQAAGAQAQRGASGTAPLAGARGKAP